MRLVQLKDGTVAAAHGTDTQARLVVGASSILDLAVQAIAAGRPLADIVAAAGFGADLDLREALEAGRIAAPVAPADPARLLVSGTGLTHLGSAEGRDAMHKAAQSTETQTDSMRMFRMGLEGGRPADGAVGVQPEWFYKGDGSILAGPDADLVSPDFALDGGEEPEIAAIYLVAPDGAPERLGFCLGNEFSDHVTEKGNYLWLAHSKLRPAAIGPELFVGALPDSVEGVSRIRRGHEIVFEKPFLSGEANMSHSIRNLEHHHFKYPQFQRPGDIHIHFFGTATLSFSHGVQTREGDVFEIEAAPFSLPLRNRLVAGAPSAPVSVRAL